MQRHEDHEGVSSSVERGSVTVGVSSCGVGGVGKGASWSGSAFVGLLMLKFLNFGGSREQQNPQSLTFLQPHSFCRTKEKKRHNAEKKTVRGIIEGGHSRQKRAEENRETSGGKNDK
ncbi:hypothetical protein NE237_000064 [Protea cynaroides]|uniref:Uncharacterized protein n=1 Tax=Protea cynaroides TaxID=273540 RepID=A0A9Q0GN99_9MAGN|nr:hypothetical protein NE237_000064 [Protea cynaroides]